ncbi:metal-dependent hydrolase [Paraburkholderia sp.]|uniref:metal-dependent hydrolase n=1 Tax=Paraburkholderia sp. TaxID=1926495 RepID=UPI00238E8313|nr:metal-dependent hydrolase [Paraburkholderia sp.]MDE1182241.1 metal-dependent hydrolase [Paraburkholderia sp.]
MASNKAHHATGWAAGLIAAAIVTRSGASGAGYIWAIGSFIAGVAGATAPDWLEVAWWSRSRRLWITHRTLTHWGIGWLAMLAVSFHLLGERQGAGGVWGGVAPVVFGFACGGVMHLLADWPNPLGVPWIYGRHSLRLWNSGHCDLIVVAAAWGAAWFVASHVWVQAGGRVLGVFKGWF